MTRIHTASETSSPRKMDCCRAVSISKYRCYRRYSGSTVYWTLLNIL